MFWAASSTCSPLKDVKLPLMLTQLTLAEQGHSQNVTSSREEKQH